MSFFSPDLPLFSSQTPLFLSKIFFILLGLSSRSVYPKFRQSFPSAMVAMAIQNGFLGTILADLYSRDGANADLCEDLPPVLGILASVLERIVLRNERFAMAATGSINPRKLTIFHGLRAPGITIAKYLERIFKYANCSPSCFVVAYAYIDRFIIKQTGTVITSRNIHRLLITSVMLAAKFLDDAYYSNAYYAKVGGLTIQEMNRLELEFLFKLDFRLNVTVKAFESYCWHLEREIYAGTRFQIDKSLQVGCGFDEQNAQAQLKNEKKRPVLRFSYAGS